MKTTELAAKYGLSKFTILSITAGVPRPPQVFGPRGPQTQEIAERNIAMVAEYESGRENLQSLGDKYGVSRERVRQILAPVGSTALVKEQRRIRREEAQAAAAELKAAVRAERAAKVAEAVELVRQGFSISEAQRRVPGLPVNGLQLECKKAGVETRHGKWRDFTVKINRARELRATGMSWNAVDMQCNAEGLGRVQPNFVGRYLPDLVEHSKQRTNGAASIVPPAPSHPPAIPRPKKVYVDRESIWTDDVVAQLKTLWFSGSTAQQCSDVFGPPFTRSAILGKIGRLRAAGNWKP
jgi:hypothetical protein